MTPLFGKLSDIYGRRSILLTGVTIFIVGSVACALAPTMWALIAARALQGIGGGGILPIAQAIIADLVSPRERPRYQSYSAIMFMVASVIGPVLGGVLTDRVHWSLIFWINVPMGAVALIMTYRALQQAAAPRAPAPARYLRRRPDGRRGDRADAGDDLGRVALSVGVVADPRADRGLGGGVGPVRAAARDCGRAADPARGAARTGGDADRRGGLLQHRRHHRAVDLRAALSPAGARRVALGFRPRADRLHRRHGDRRVRGGPLARPQPALHAPADGWPRDRHGEPRRHGGAAGGAVARRPFMPVVPVRRRDRADVSGDHRADPECRPAASVRRRHRNAQFFPPARRHCHRRRSRRHRAHRGRCLRRPRRTRSAGAGRSEARRRFLHGVLLGFHRRRNLPRCGAAVPCRHRGAPVARPGAGAGSPEAAPIAAE